MNPCYTIMYPLKIPLGKIVKNINASFIEDSKKYLTEDLNFTRGFVQSCIKPKFISTTELHLVDNIRKKYLETYLLPTLLDLYMDSTMYAPSRRSIIENKNLNLDMQGLWVVEYDADTYFNLHSHVSAPNYLSFSWYLKCKDNRKVIFVADNKEYVISVSEGDVLLFPSWLPHRADGENSITCSGNFVVNILP